MKANKFQSTDIVRCRAIARKLFSSSEELRRITSTSKKNFDADAIGILIVLLFIVSLTHEV